MQLFTRYFASAWAVALLALVLAPRTSVHAAPEDDYSIRTILDPFRVSFEPIDHELSTQEQLLVRSLMEEVLSDYLLETYQWPPTVSAIFVALARIYNHVPILDPASGAITGASVTFDGIIYYSNSSQNVPSAQDLVPAIQAALTPDAMVAALQRQFPTIAAATLLPQVPTTDAPTASPRPQGTMSLTASPAASVTSVPTIAAIPTSSPVTSAPAVPTAAPTAMTPAPQSVDGLESGPTQLTASPKDTDMGTIAGATAGALLVALVGFMLVTRRQRNRRSDKPSTVVHESTIEDDLQDNNNQKLRGLATLETRTMTATTVPVVVPKDSLTPADQDTSGNKASLRQWMASGFYKSFSKSVSRTSTAGDEEPPHLAMTDGEDDESDGLSSELQSEADVSLGLGGDATILGRCSSVASPSTGGGDGSSSGAATMVRSMESFEHQQQHVLRKDLMESPDLSAATLYHYSNNSKARGLLVPEDRYNCALSPTDVTAASLAMKPRRDESDVDEDDEDTDVENPKFPSPPSRLGIQPASPPRSNQQDEVEEEAELFSKGLVAGIFSTFWGGKKEQPPRMLTSSATSGYSGTDDDTFGAGRGDWDPDDDDASSARSSLAEVFDVLAKEEQTLLNSQKTESYQLQQIRTPPPTTSDNRPKRQLAPVSPLELFQSGDAAKEATTSQSRRRVVEHYAGESSDDEYNVL